MPRAKKPIIERAPSTAYGRGVDTAQAIAAVPIADNRGASADALRAGVQAAGSRAAAVTQPQVGPPPAPAGDPAMAAANAMSVQGLLSAPSAYPQRPVTHGLAQGPGAGPEALMGAGDVAAGAPIWRQLAAATGDPYFIELAQRAGLA